MLKILQNKVSVHAQCEDTPTLMSMVLWHPLPTKPRQYALTLSPCAAKDVVVMF